MIYSLESQNISFIAMFFHQVSIRNPDIIICKDHIFALRLRKKFTHGALPKIICIGDIPLEKHTTKTEMIIAAANSLSSFSRDDAIKFASDSLVIIETMYYANVLLGEFYKQVPHDMYARFEKDIMLFVKIYKMCEKISHPYYVAHKNGMMKFVEKHHESLIAFAGILPIDTRAKILMDAIKNCEIFLYNARDFANKMQIADVSVIKYGRDVGEISIDAESLPAKLYDVTCKNFYDVSYNAAIFAIQAIGRGSFDVAIVVDENPSMICVYLEKHNVSYYSDFASDKAKNPYILALFTSFDVLKDPDSMLFRMSFLEIFDDKHYNNAAKFSQQDFPFLQEIKSLNGTSFDVITKLYKIVSHFVLNSSYLQDFKDFIFFLRSEMPNIIFKDFHDIYEVMRIVTWKFWKKSKNASVFILNSTSASLLEFEKTIVIYSDKKKSHTYLFSEYFLERCGIIKMFDEGKFAMDNIMKSAESIVIMHVLDQKLPYKTSGIIQKYDVERAEYMPQKPLISLACQELSKIHITALEKYMDDPFGFYVRNIAGIKPIQYFNAKRNTDVGNALHKAFETYINTGKNIMVCAKKILQDVDLTHILPFCEKSILQAVKNLPVGVNSEKTVDINVDGVMVTAKMDAISAEAIIDFKTHKNNGKYNKNIAFRGKLLQLTFANYAMSSNRSMQYFCLSSELDVVDIEIDMIEHRDTFEKNLQILIQKCKDGYFVSKVAQYDDYFHLKRRVF